MRTLLAITLLALLPGCDGSSKVRELPDGGVCTATGECEELYPITSKVHVPEPVDYSDTPPAGGPHSACWTEWGVHATAVPDERFVHNLEHGGVGFLYNCPDGCAAEQAELESLTESRPFAVVVPYQEMTAKFATVAWGYRLVTDALDLEAFEAFYDEHVDQGPEKFPLPPPEPPGSCSVR